MKNYNTIVTLYESSVIRKHVTVSVGNGINGPARRVTLTYVE
jgi:hypothetical protein